MQKRFISIVFRHLITDWFCRCQPQLRQFPFVLTASRHGRKIIVAANTLAQQAGIYEGMVLTDARMILPSVKVLDDKPGSHKKILSGLAEWCIRFTPLVSIDPAEGLILDVTGCAHLWGGEAPYLADIIQRFTVLGYEVQAAMADTIGAAWAVARYGENVIVESGRQVEALLNLPPEALRLDITVVERLHKLGLRKIKDFLSIPRSSLRRRFGKEFIVRLHQAMGVEEEIIEPIHPAQLYMERLPCLEPIVTAAGIELALERLLEALCKRLQHEEKGLRLVVFKCFRVDGKIEHIEIGTGSPSNNAKHLFKLFEIKLSTIQPALGIELFLLEALNLEDHAPVQEKIWNDKINNNTQALIELLDRLANRIGSNQIHRYLPAEHYIPERSFSQATSLHEEPATTWKMTRPRPLHLLSPPHCIEVTAPIPDYPPMLFKYKGKLHKIIKADGPERIEQEWWIGDGRHRDYYAVEDEEGCRYWLFRSGHYAANQSPQWYLHGFFA